MLMIVSNNYIHCERLIFHDCKCLDTGRSCHTVLVWQLENVPCFPDGWWKPVNELSDDLWLHIGTFFGCVYGVAYIDYQVKPTRTGRNASVRATCQCWQVHGVVLWVPIERKWVASSAGCLSDCSQFHWPCAVLKAPTFWISWAGLLLNRISVKSLMLQYVDDPRMKKLTLRRSTRRQMWLVDATGLTDSMIFNFQWCKLKWNQKKCKMAGTNYVLLRQPKSCESKKPRRLPPSKFRYFEEYAMHWQIDNALN